MSDDFDEGLWIYAGPPPGEGPGSSGPPPGPGCAATLAILVFLVLLFGSGFGIPLLAVGVVAFAWKLLVGTR